MECCNCLPGSFSLSFGVANKSLAYSLDYLFHGNDRFSRWNSVYQIQRACLSNGLIQFGQYVQGYFLIGRVRRQDAPNALCSFVGNDNARSDGLAVVVVSKCYGLQPKRMHRFIGPILRFVNTPLASAVYFHNFNARIEGRNQTGMPAQSSGEVFARVVYEQNKSSELLLQSFGSSNDFAHILACVLIRSDCSAIQGVYHQQPACAARFNNCCCQRFYIGWLAYVE